MSHVERYNLQMRMRIRRFTRLKNARSKSLAHDTAMQALFVVFYNFCRPHGTLKGTTPAMAAGLTGKAWTTKEPLEHAAAK